MCPGLESMLKQMSMLLLGKLMMKCGSPSTAVKSKGKITAKKSTTASHPG